MRKLFITDQPWPTTDEVKEIALASGATEVVHGIPLSLSDQIPEGTLGYYELEEPVVEQVEKPITTEQEIENIRAEINQLLARLEALEAEV